MKISKSIFPMIAICCNAVSTLQAQAVITKQPLDQSVSLGAAAKFQVLVTSSAPPIRYQWSLNGSELAGQTNSALTITNVQLFNEGGYFAVVTDGAGAVTSKVARLEVDPTFTKVTSGPIVNDRAYSAGGTWGDFNNDSFPDLLVFNGNGNYDGTPYNPFLYQNSGEGTFLKIAGGLPVTIQAQSYAAVWGDIDNDGNLDLFMAGSKRNFLFQNQQGGKSFIRITSGPLATDTPAGWGTLGAAWADYDQDGRIDLFVANFDPSGVVENLLYHNQGNGTFARVTNSIVLDKRSSLGCAWGDYDNDGYVDFFVCGGTGHGSSAKANRLYHNNGDGTFTRVLSGSIATDLAHSSSASWGDYDNDGYLDLFVGNLDIDSTGNFLYHNNRDGTFTRILNDVVVINRSNVHSCAWADYDNDGFLDLFVANADFTAGGFPSATVNFLYHNNGDGTFTKLTSGSPANDYNDSWGCAWADYDKDGFPDLFVARGDLQGNYLYRNNGNSNSWVAINLVGRASNRAGIGAKVRVTARIGGVSRSQLRQISGGGGFLGSNELVANFGLGDATNIESIRIEWPSGIFQTLTNIAPRQYLTIEEHQEAALQEFPRLNRPILSGDGSVRLEIAGPKGLRYVIESSTNLTNWSWVAARTNSTGTIEFADRPSTVIGNRFYRVLIP